MKILIGIATAGNIPVEFQNCLDRLKSCHEVSRIFIARSVIHIAREQIADQAVAGGYDAVLYLDDDMVFEPDVVDMLAAQTAPVVSAPCFKRVPPYDPCFYTKIEIDGMRLRVYPAEFDRLPDEPFNVLAAGAACMLVRCDLLRKLPKPWFLPLPYSGEDLSFCLKLAKIGVEVMIEPQARVGHLETRAIYCEHYLAAKEARHEV